jgi:hypothetical protein
VVLDGYTKCDLDAMKVALETALGFFTISAERIE